MSLSMLVARWTLGGTMAVIAGLAVSAEPLAPPMIGETPALSAPLRSASLSGDARLGDAPDAAPAEAVARASVRPVARALAMVPVEIHVRSGASVRPVARGVYMPEARWDGRAAAESWTEAAMRAIDAAPQDLTDVEPADIDRWCPGYERNPPHLRAAFWVGTVSALARYESTFNPGAVGGGGAWHGLLQISPATARHYGCAATSGEALRDGEANIACAIRIMSRTVSRDGVVAAGGGGIAADWGPMSRESLREQIRGWVSERQYCEVQTAVMASLRPQTRPQGATALRLAALSRDERPGG